MSATLGKFHKQISSPDMQAVVSVAADSKCLHHVPEKGKAAGYASDNTLCCFFFSSRPPPLVHIREYFYTSSRCSIQGVIFITRKNRQLCANPKKKWVRSYINSLEMS
ncbi:C-C motif chemokine 5-like [Gracilinanus agilis]|uniref:C-C motif chemokine 5-like n=1 Tax=Gracilinanus agilis TaxID=191870 RepID=UPI001CFF3EFC|nr:C-C motif chemokine 5-like [Gracilinanus agilis]